jgi:hypothetical protein
LSGILLGILALLLVGGASALWFRRALRVRLPADRTPFVVAWAGGALLGAIALLGSPGWIGGIPAGLAAVGGLFLTVLVGISRQVVGPEALRVGAPIPEFTATDDSGSEFAIASTRGRPLLLKFFRGHW